MRKEDEEKHRNKLSSYEDGECKLGKKKNILKINSLKNIFFLHFLK